ncbi:serine protease [Chytridiales sp. JEL 0842]|nr:serine protease [Chytridiales sp. JEL 0842]
MRVFSLITLAIGAFTQIVIAAPSQPAAGTPIPNQYIVVFKNTTEPSTLATHEAWLEQTARVGSTAAPQYRRIDGVAFPDIPSCNFFKYLHHYNSGNSRGAFRGYAAKITPEIAESLRALPEVAFVEQDTVVTTFGGIFDPAPTTQPPVPTTTTRPPVITTTTTIPTVAPNPTGGASQSGAPWGLRRLSKPDLPLPNLYSFNSAAGEGVDAYIIDTGVLISHPDFEGRARVGASFSTDNNDVDGNGHGTHVAGTVAGKTYGVAKKANIIAVKVLSGSGSGSNSDVIAGVNWVAQQASRSGRKSVANMSLGGGANTAVDNAVAAAVRAGVTMVVAAGNNGRDACSNSPARTPDAITVAASDINDVIASFSDRGTCVDIIAPGVNILSSWNNGATRSISGTSMASPHVAGVVAVAMSAGKITTPASAVAYFTSTGVKDKITGITSTTKNVLAQVEL